MLNQVLFFANIYWLFLKISVCDAFKLRPPTLASSFVVTAHPVASCDDLG
jgi:hypothetical protein